MDTVLQNLTDQIQAATANKTALRIRGAGSKDFYGETPQGQLLDASALTGIISYEPTELVVTVRAGTPLAELETVLAEKGQYLPFEPPHFNLPGTPGAQVGTCGGMVAAGVNGPARASSGGVRDFVLGVQLINGRAEHLTFGGQVMKNVAGYDVTRLMVGSMGSLGLLTEISLKVLPLPPAQATLVFQVDQARALAQLHRWGGQPLPLNASCWVRDDSTTGTPELLFVRLRGAVAAVQSAIQKMTQDLPGQLLDNAQAAADWAACRDLRLPFFTQTAAPGSEPLALWRLSVPQTTPMLNLPWPQLVEWHGGQRWLYAPLSAQERLRQVATEVGGSATLFVAGSAFGERARSRFHPLNPAALAVHQRLKAEFDPAGIFNPGRMFPGL
jgi:glycolate oxidase FAD binding subunit